MPAVLRAAALILLSPAVAFCGADRLRDLQREAVENKTSPAAHWGTDPDKYVTWSTHTNRLIPVYAFGTRGAGDGVDLGSYTGPNSAYRDEAKLRRIYGYLPTNTVAPAAEYMDQTDVYRLQKAALDAGKRRVILFVFDGMDWQTTRAAAIAKTRRAAYDAGRGTGLHFQDYDAAGTTQFGFMVTSPHNEGTKVDVDAQIVKNPGGTLRGGYDPARGGTTPWDAPAVDDPPYLIGKSEAAGSKHAYTDSSSSATSMTAGAKIYNNAVNVNATGIPLETIAHQAQRRGYAVGAVSSVPISHATPACAYAHNVDRDDYQDLTRDLLGLPSVAHPETPLPGLDVLIGGGWGAAGEKDAGQGKNFVPGNRFLTDEDRAQVDVRNGGRYVVAERTAGVDGTERLASAASEAAASGRRLFGFYGAKGNAKFDGNLPLRGAAGDYKPGPGWGGGEIEYAESDVAENPTLAEMATAALMVLEKDPEGFWLMVEAGDVDWANHDNNLDASVGATLSGDDAVRAVTDWVERHGGWDDTVLIVTADHGHYLVLDDPHALAGGVRE